MSLQFVNVSGATVGLVQAGNTVATLPFGFVGGVEVSGAVEVVKLGQQVVTTNTLGSDLSVVGGGTVWTNANNQRVVGQTYYATNDFVSFKAGGLVIANLYANQDYNLHYTWDGTAVLFLGSENSTEPNLVDITDLTGGGVTTNGDASVLLGTINSVGGIRQCTAMATELKVETYAGHVEAFGWGLALGVVVFTYRWMVNVMGSIGREHDL